MSILEHVRHRDVKRLTNYIQVHMGCSDDEAIELQACLQSLFTDQALPSNVKPRSERDFLILEDVCRTLANSRNSKDGESAPNDRALVCGPANGCLTGKFGNSIIEWVNVVINMLVSKRTRVTVISAVKDEGPWLLEWIAHYKSLGVESIIIYYNDCNDGSAEILKCLAAANEIIAIENITAPGISPQNQAFAHALSLLRTTHGAEWVAFFDSDEFLVADEPLSSMWKMVDAIRSKAISSSIDCIAINWEWFSDLDQFTWNEGLVVDRFRTAFAHGTKKCIFRPESALSIEEIHYPSLLTEAVAVSSSGFLIESLRADRVPESGSLARLNHYFAKSFQEYALKRSRGRGTLPVGSQTGLAYDNFLWGGGGGTPREINPKLRLGIVRELDRLFAVAGLREIDNMTKKRARDRLAEISVEQDLARMYEEVMSQSRR